MLIELNFVWQNKIFSFVIICMKINSFNFLYTPSFLAKSKTARKADDIQRRAKANFPVMSVTYLNDNYGVFADKNGKYYEKAHLYRLNLDDKIHSSRKNISNEIYDKSYDNPLFGLNSWLCGIKKNKIGNCAENARIALAALYANGYYNSSLVLLYYNVNILDRKTNEMVMQYPESLDHCFVVTDMKKGLNKDNPKNYVLDLWLGFGSSKEDADRKFKAFYGKDKLEEIKNNAIKLFFKKDKPDLERYQVRAKFEYMPACYYSSEDNILEAAKLLRKN